MVERLVVESLAVERAAVGTHEFGDVVAVDFFADKVFESLDNSVVAHRAALKDHVVA